MDIPERERAAVMRANCSRTTVNPALSESYACRYEAYLTDYRLEPRKLLWEVELSIKLATA